MWELGSFPSAPSRRKRESHGCWWPHRLGSFQGHHVRLGKRNTLHQGLYERNILQLYLNGLWPRAHFLITIWLPMWSWQYRESEPMDHVCTGELRWQTNVFWILVYALVSCEMNIRPFRETNESKCWMRTQYRITTQTPSLRQWELTSSTESSSDLQLVSFKEIRL